MNKHTSGPWVKVDADDWSIDTRGSNTYCFIGQEGHDPIAIAVVTDAWSRDKELDANSRLIAAAPDLLEAIHVIGMSAGWQYLTMETRALVEAAIAKAEGVSHD